MKKVVLLSGGMDSATVLAVVKKNYPQDEIIALNMFYGQRHACEIESARNIAKHYGVELKEFDISQVFSSFKSALIPAAGIEVNDAEKAVLGGTYVPGRNIIFLAIAAGLAESLGADTIYYGAHADDHSGYPDCTPAFLQHMAQAILTGTASHIKVEAPFVNLHKSDIVKAAIQLDVPLELTHSCYRGEYPPCGTCPTCQLRAQAFTEAGYEDPLLKERKHESN